MRSLAGVPSPLWAVIAAGVVLLVGCARETPPRAPEDEAPLFRTETFVFRCEGDYRFSARVSPDTAIVNFGEEEAVLPNVISASGARYSADGVVFWSKGLVAQLEAPGSAYSDCVGQAADTDAEAAALLAREGPTGIPLAAVEWRLMSVAGIPAIPGADETLPSLSIDEAEGRVAGSAGCNRMMGGYSAEGEALRFTQLATTRMACLPDSVMDQEQRLLEALERSREYLVWGDILTLFDGEGSAVARFTAGNG